MFSVPGPNNDEYSPQGVSSHRNAALFIGMFISNGHGEFVVENRDRVREVDAVFLAIRHGFVAVPLELHGFQYMHKRAYGQHW